MSDFCWRALPGDRGFNSLPAGEDVANIMKTVGFADTPPCDDETVARMGHPELWRSRWQMRHNLIGSAFCIST